MTKFSEKWVTSRCTVTKEYKWNGEVYPTLTHISWKATGCQIGGNTFFGLPGKRYNSHPHIEYIRRQSRRVLVTSNLD